MGEKKKTPRKEKGLSDQELIEKYEDGEVRFVELVEKMMQTPSKASHKTEKQTKKRQS